jgi:serine O-acetyltransferase
MKMSMQRTALCHYVVHQLNTFFKDDSEVHVQSVSDHIDAVMERVEYCFSKVNNKYFYDGSSVIFNHLHGDQYCMFLYYLSNTLYRRNGDPIICSKIFLLNKLLHGIDAYYEVMLPDIFLVIHPLATVLGRATYGDYFIVYQRCGIGSNHDIYPVLGNHVTMHPGSVILGNCRIGDNCKLAAESLIIDCNIEKDTIYMGNPKQSALRSETQTSKFWRS